MDDWTNAIVGNYAPDVLQRYVESTGETPRFGIVGAIKNAFGDEYSVYAKEDVKQDFEGPAFFVYKVLSTFGKGLNLRRTADFNFDIHCFPKSEKNMYIEFGEVEMMLSEILETIEILDPESLQTFTMSGDQMSSSVTDGVMHFFVHFDITFMRPAPELPAMETLEQTTTTKE